MKKLLPLVLLLLLPVRAFAFSNSELLSLVAMPLAVDAAARVTGVPQDQLAQFVSSLNEASVPPQQFVQTVRYAPVALQQPDFYPYVQQQTAKGVGGYELVDAIDQRLPQYGVNVEPYQATPEAVTSDSYIPAIIAALSSGNRSSLLSLVAMPLAVAAIGEMAGVPQDQLASLVASLNQANVPPAQFVDTLRYVPVALIEQPELVPYVQTQVSNGVTGPALITDINRQMTWYSQQAPSSSSMTVVNNDYVPQSVRTRVAEARVHPHGGPPGQLKKTLGLRTGAEVVHGGYAQATPAPAVAWVPPGQAKKNGHGAEQEVHGHHGRGNGGKHGEKQAENHGNRDEERQVVMNQPMVSAVPVAPVFVPPGQQEGHGHGHGPGGEGPPGQQKEKGGKGHGKD